MCVLIIFSDHIMICMNRIHSERKDKKTHCCSVLLIAWPAHKYHWLLLSIVDCLTCTQVSLTVAQYCWFSWPAHKYHWLLLSIVDCLTCTQVSLTVAQYCWFLDLHTSITNCCSVLLIFLTCTQASQTVAALPLPPPPPPPPTFPNSQYHVSYQLQSEFDNIVFVVDVAESPIFI